MTATRKPNPPTAKQLRFLRDLADRTGTTFTYPDTSGEAAREINRLLQRTPSPRFEHIADRHATTRDKFDTGTTTIRPDEITGYGATARWR